MKYLMIAIFLASTAAYGQGLSDSPPVAPAAVTSQSTSAPAPAPPQPTMWGIMDLDKRDLNDINGYAMACPKSVADPLIALLNAKIKAMK